MKNPLNVPTKALADAIAEEWALANPLPVSRHPSPGKMPLTSLAYTAIDRIAGQQDAIAEVLLAYVDTDTLSYRSSGSQTLAKTQGEQWDPIVSWMSKTFGAIWQITTGIMPLEQPAAMHEAIAAHLRKQDHFRLSALCVLASLFSSLALALAVLEKRANAKDAFALSRLEEESQAQAWGRDAQADARARKMQEEIMAAAHFLRLLEPA